MFGISGGEFLVLLVVGALVLGPRNIAQALRAVRNAIESVRDWSSRLRAESNEGELGLTEADIATLKSLDLRQLDPRRIVREAVREEMDAWMAVAGADTGVVGAGETSAYSSAAFARASSAMPDQDTSTPGRVDVSDVAAPSTVAPSTAAPNVATPHVPRRRTLQDQVPKTLESSFEPTAPQTSIKGDNL